MGCFADENTVQTMIIFKVKFWKALRICTINVIPLKIEDIKSIMETIR